MSPGLLPLSCPTWLLENSLEGNSNAWETFLVSPKGALGLSPPQLEQQAASISRSCGFPLLLLPKAVSNQPAMLAPALGGFNKRQMCVTWPSPLRATDPNCPKVWPLHTSVLRSQREWKITRMSNSEDTKRRSGVEHSSQQRPHKVTAAASDNVIWEEGWCSCSYRGPHKGNLMGVINMYDVRRWVRFPHSVELKKKEKERKRTLIKNL